MKSEMTLTQMAQELERRKGAKVDLLADTRKLQMDNEARLVISTPGGLGSRTYDINEVAHTQIAERLGIGTRYYNRMRKEDPELLAANVNNWFNDKPETRMVRTLDGTARAFLSDRYNRIDNDEIAEAALPVLLGVPGIDVVSTAVTDTRMYIKATTDKVQGEVKRGDVVQAGLVISNSEVGLGMVKVEQMVYRLVCSNGMISGSSIGSYNIRHVGGKLDAEENVRHMLTDETKQADDKAMMLKLRDVIAGAFSPELFAQQLNRMQEAASDRINGNPVEAVKVLAKRHSFTEFEQNSVLRNLIEGADLSRWGMLNAVTATAKADELSYDRATELETLGGIILNLNPADWRLVAEAA